MNPTLYEGNKMLVSGLFYKPKAGDVVIFKNVDRRTPGQGPGQAGHRHRGAGDQHRL